MGYGFWTLKPQILLVGIRGREKPQGSPGLQGGLLVTLTTQTSKEETLGDFHQLSFTTTALQPPCASPKSPNSDGST